MSAKPVKKRTVKKAAKKFSRNSSEEPDSSEQLDLSEAQSNPSLTDQSPTENENSDSDQGKPDRPRDPRSAQIEESEKTPNNESTQKRVERAGPVVVVRDARTNPSSDQKEEAPDQNDGTSQKSDFAQKESSQVENGLSVVVEESPKNGNDHQARSKHNEGDEQVRRDKKQNVNSDKNEDENSDKDNNRNDNREGNDRRNRGKNRQKGDRNGNDRNDRPDVPKENKRDVQIDEERLKVMAWEIYRSEVCEEGLALLDPRSMREYARSSFRAARIFLEEEGQL